MWGLRGSKQKVNEHQAGDAENHSGESADQKRASAYLRELNDVYFESHGRHRDRQQQFTGVGQQLGGSVLAETELQNGQKVSRVQKGEDEESPHECGNQPPIVNSRLPTGSMPG